MSFYFYKKAETRLCVTIILINDLIRIAITFRKNLPFTRLSSLIGGNLVAKIIEKGLHLVTTFAFSHLVAGSKGGSTTVWGCGFGGIRVVC